MIREYAAEVEIAAPAEEVWAKVTDWRSHSDWVVGTRVAVTAGDGASVGSQLIAFTGVLDMGFLDPVEITDWEPPRRCVAKHLGTLLRGTAEFFVEPRGHRTYVRWVERLDPPFGLFGELVMLLAGPGVSWGLRRSLRRLATICESARR